MEDKLIQIIKNNIIPLEPIPTNIKPKTKKISITTFIFDIYGTLMISASGDIHRTYTNFSQEEKLLQLFREFGINKNPEKLNKDFKYRVEKEHQKKRKQGIDYPEILVENIWKSILNLEDESLIKEFIIRYEMITNPVYPMPSLSRLLNYLKNNNLIMGIISNAQFYTPLFFKALLNKGVTSLGFNKDLICYSYKSLHAKPSIFMFKKMLNILNKRGIKPQNVLYTGNDILNDIYPAKKMGFHTCLFAGDKRSLRLRKNNIKYNSVEPDIVITNLGQIIKCINKK